MKAIFAIIKKEFSRFFLDRRMVLTTLLLPGLLIYVVYTAIGSITSAIAEVPSTPTVYVQNMPESLSDAIGGMFEVRQQSVSDEEAKEQIRQGDIDLLVIFPENFDELDATSGEVPSVSIYYYSAETASSSAYSMMVALLDGYEQQISNVFDINSGGDVYDLADSSSVSMYILSMIVPMVLIMLMLSGCVSVVLESIAGEKERGTIATLLVTPMKRSSLAVGKILSLSVIAMLSGISSFVGLILSLPNMMGGTGVDFSLAAYGALDYIGLLLVVISTVLVFVALLSIISAYARSTKEANGLIAPVMILIMVCSLCSMFLTSPSIGFFFIPVLNSALCISSLMAGTFAVAPFVITMCVNLVFAALLSVILTFMFNSEKVMFNS
ncbi:MAG TPA: ABC transporter permease [Candidatus Coproplasma avicola]|uniref:ABC transporter permease n=1 Tax=Candidatus Coproplasma avicola TaxID=2840744 RepID=A0A9D1J939_9FIRM|nr:ABC transporter permease [Candidatus Coproplasma avicola]